MTQVCRYKALAKYTKTISPANISKRLTLQASVKMRRYKCAVGYRAYLECYCRVCF